jgi:hypothetical protein
MLQTSHVPVPIPEPERSWNEERCLWRMFTLNCSWNRNKRGTWPHAHIPRSRSTLQSWRKVGRCLPSRQCNRSGVQDSQRAWTRDSYDDRAERKCHPTKWRSVKGRCPAHVSPTWWGNDRRLARSMWIIPTKIIRLMLFVFQVFRISNISFRNKTFHDKKQLCS